LADITIRPLLALIKKHSDVLILGCLALIVLGAGLGLRDPWPADEPRFALIVRDMLATGDWLIPFRGGEIYPDKPPLFFWTMAIALLLTGSLKLAFLLPSFLASLGVLFFVYDLARRLWNDEIARYAALLLLLTLQFVLQAKYAQIDALLTFWTTLGLYGFIRYLLLDAHPVWLLVGFTACGLGVITKGVGILPILVFVPYAYAVYRKWVIARNTSLGLWVMGVIALLLPILSWLVPMWFVVENSGDAILYAYRDNILFRQTLTRYGNSWGHIKPFWYYLTQIPILWLPLSLLLPWLIPEWYQCIKNKKIEYLLLLGFAALVLLFFSISPGKRGVYILPILPAMVLAAAPFLPKLITNINVNRLAFIASLVLVSSLLAVAGYAVWGDSHRLSSISIETLYTLSAVLFVFSLSMLTVIILIKPVRGSVALSSVIVLFWLMTSLVIVPELNAYRSGKDFILGVEALLLPEDELAIVGYKEQFLLQAQGSISHFGYGRNNIEELQDAVTWLKKKSTRKLLVRESIAKSCFSNRGQKVGYANSSYWVLIDGGESTECIGSPNPYTVFYQK